MTLQTLLDRFDLLMDTPESVPKLRRFILRLAVEGRLTRQKTEESASSLLNRIQSRKQKLLAENDSPRRKSLGEMPDDFPFELPQNWTWTRLDDVCPYIQRGKRPDYSEREEIPVVSQKCVQWDGFKSDRVRFIDPESLDKYQSYRFLQKGDLLWNSTGVGTVGRVNVYRSELDEYPRVVADSHVTVVRPIKEMMLPEYIYCWIGSTHIQSKVETEMTSGTTKQTELNTSTVRKTLLPLPPVEEQNRIVETVDELMDECDALEEQQKREHALQVQVGTAATKALQSADDAEQLRPAWERVRGHFDTVTATPEGVDALRQTILQLAVQGRLTERDPDDTPTDVLLKEIQQEKQRLYDAGEIRKPKDLAPVANPPASLPSHWTWTRVGEITGMQGGYAFKSSWYEDEGIRLVRNTNISHGYIDWSETARLPNQQANEFERFQLRKGDILLSLDRPIISTGLKVARVTKGDLPALLVQRVGRFELEVSAINDDYFFFWLHSPHFLEGIDPGRSNAIPHISQKEVLKLPFPLPPLSEQKRIAGTLARLLPLCDRLNENVDNLSERGEKLLEAALRNVSVGQQDGVPTSVTA
ncbi:restriction endonuclease subunit S [Salinibacter ruber]|uniref:restriction endonuclease subunit S n=1 Tax=Salinibacter ruber TaxID=146919 RepID=UPI002167B870|nr:restriction endonuclease subunit S [Salinibacter ruber]MCS4201731.1 type I restriction enzyme S subunit [Salinibacter ruber]